MINEQFLTNLNTSIQNYGYSFDKPYEERGEAFYLSVIYSFIYDWGKNTTLMPYSWNKAGTRSFTELRAYAASKQDVSKYKKQLIFNKPAKKRGHFDGQMETYQNISWEPVAILPKLVDIVVNKIAGHHFDYKVMAVDPKSIGDKEFKKGMNRLLLEPKMQEFINQMNEAGANITMKSAFKSVEQMETFENTVGYQILAESTLQELILKSNIDSRYEEILRMVIRDLVVCGVAGVMDYSEQFTGEALYKYIDPQFTIVDNSQYSDCRDILRAGHFEMMTLGELRRVSNLPDDTLKEIARTYANNFANPTSSGWLNQVTAGVDAFKNRFGYQSTYDYRIPVFHMRFIGTEEVDGHRHEYVYKCSWVVNSRYVFDYGKDSYSPKSGQDGNMVTRLPYHFYKTDGSLVERVIGMVDDICLNEYKKRNIRSRMIPSPGLVFEEESLNSVNVGGSIFGVQDNLALLYEAGAMVIRTKDQFNNTVGGGRNAITNIQDDSFQKIQALTSDSVNQLALIKDILGINEFVDASSPQPRVGLGIANMAYEGALNSMKTILYGTKSIYEDTLYSILLRWQLLSAEGYETVLSSFSETKARVIKLTKDVYFRKFGIYVRLSNSDMEIAELKQSLIALRNQRTTSRQGGLTGSQYLICSNLLDQRKISECIFVMSEFEEENHKKDMQVSAALQQQNGEVQQQANMAAAEAKMQEIALKMQGELALQQEENKGKILDTIIDGMIKSGILKDKQEFLSMMAQQKNEGMSAQTRGLSADVQTS